MPDHAGHDEPQGPSEEELEASIARGYEKLDVSLPVLGQWGFALLVLMGGAAVAMLIMYRALTTLPFLQPQVASAPYLRSDAIRPAAGIPIVQDKPVVDIKDYRRDEEEKLNEFAVRDGKIHIPIEKAMQIVVKDLPAQKEGETLSGVAPTPEMKLRPDTGAGGTSGSNPLPAIESPNTGKGGPRRANETPHMGTGDSPDAIESPSRQ